MDAVDDAGAQIALEYVGTYLALKHQIADLEVQAGEAREAAIESLDALNHPPGTEWVYEGLGVVQVVKGRVTEKLDRTRLARAGVSTEVLDAATVRTEGAPSVRISSWKGRAPKSPSAHMVAKGWAVEGSGAD